MLKKVKIAILIDQLVPGGVQKCAIEEVRELNKLGFDAKLLILMRDDYETKNRNLLKDIPYQFLSDSYPKIFQKTYKFPIFNFFSSLHILSPFLAPLILKKGTFDLIVSHGTTTTFTAWALNRQKIPYITIIHDPMLYIFDKIYPQTKLRYFSKIIKPILKTLDKNLIKASKFCVIDSTVHRQYIRNLGTEPEIMYLTAKDQKITPRGDKILTFGRWDKTKDLDKLLEVLELIPGSKLLLAGSWTNPEDLESFKKLIYQKRLEKRVELITFYRDEDLGKICAQGRVWIHPHFEAFSLSGLEAASFGLPIVIPRGSGVSELFTEGEHGFFPTSTSPKDFANVITPLLKNKNLAAKMGTNGAKLVRKNYTPEHRAQSLAKIILKILKPALQLTALETGFIGKSGVSGGDILLEEMTKRMEVPLNLNVIIPYSNTKHWENSGLKVNLQILRKNFFDNFLNPWSMFLTYSIRVFNSLNILLKLNPPIIYSSTGIFPDIIPAFLAKIYNPKIYWIARFHHLLPSPKKRIGNYLVNLGAYILQWFSIRLMLRSDLLIALNDNVNNYFTLLKHKNVTTLGGGVDSQSIQKFKPLKTQLYDAVFLGRLHRTKGVFDLPSIWKIVIHSLPEATLAIIGPTEKNIKHQLLLEIKAVGLEKNIFILGFLPQNKVWSILKTSKVFLFTDHEAGFGLAVAEAMAAGRPVIGWDIGILGSVFKKGFVKVPFQNREMFASAVINLLKNPSKLKKFSALAQHEAAAHDWIVVKEKFVNLLASNRH